MNPAEFSIENRLISVIVIVIALTGGWYAYENMPRFEDPEFTIRTAQIVTRYPGATPKEVADEVTKSLETAVQQLQEVEEIRSTSSPGVSRLEVDIKYEFSPSKGDLQIIWGKLRNKVEDAQSGFPPGVQKSVVHDDFGDVYGLYYLVTGQGFSSLELNDYAKSLRTDLMTVEGVAKVQVTGAQAEAIYVEISKQRTAALGIAIEQVYSDLAQQNSVVSAGDVQVGNRRLLIHPTGEIDSVKAIGNVVVSTSSSGALIYLHDIAEISRAYQSPQTFLIRYNGKPAIGIAIANVTGANVAKMGAGIDAMLRDAESRRPLGIEVHEFYHQGRIVNAAVEDFTLNVVAALFIVIVTLLIFMGLRSALVIGAVLLLTIAATLVTMYVTNIPMHRISLGALIIALGMLVDNAIVVTDGILVGTQQGRKKIEIAGEVVLRTRWPLLGGTIVGIIAFAPIGFAPGSTAEYTGHLFWVVMISLLFSWIFAITAVPFLADLLFKETAAASTAGNGWFFRVYKRFLAAVLRARWLVIGLTFGLFGFSMWGFQFVKGGFFPASSTPQIVVDYWLPEATDISVTLKDMLRIEEELMGLPGIDAVQTLVGAGTVRYMLVYPPQSPNSSYGQFLLKVTDFKQIGSLASHIQSYLDDHYPDAQGKVWQFQLGPGGGSKIEATFSGHDPVVLRRLASQAKTIMVADGGAISIKDDWRQQVSVLRPIYSESRGRRLGISREDLAHALRTNFSGRAVGVFREGDNLIPIIARAPVAERTGVEHMAGIQIASPITRRSVPLIETVDGFETVWRNSQLRRVDRVWTINAQSDPMPGTLASELQARLEPQIEAIALPDGYVLEWNGEIGASSKANENLAKTLPLGLLAMVLVVVLLFNALRQPLIIWMVVPLALIGVVFGLIVTGTALEFMAILGLLSLSGLLIKNGIMLVDQMDLEIASGKPRHDAVIASATSRVRPVMMGSLTTMLGVIPLFGDAFFRSMAVVLVFGLSFATILTLIVLPALYVVFFRIVASETGDKIVI